jgi:TonB family protein
MIPRQLVPRDVRPLAETPALAPRRLTTLLDDRELVPANWPHIPLDTRSSIPAHLPLDVLASRVVVPRDVPLTPLDPASLHPDYAPVTPLDHRITVPMALPVVELEPKGRTAIQDLPGVLDPDVITTGEINLMVEPVETPPRDWNWTGMVWAASVAVHLAFILFLMIQPRLFPPRQPTQQQIDLARQQLSFIYMPPDVRGLPRTPAPAPNPRIRIDPRVLRRLSPGEIQQMPVPKAPNQAPTEAAPVPPPDLTPAPKPQTATPQNPPNFLRPQEPPVQQARKVQPPAGSLILPRMSSPGRELQQSAEQALRGGGGSSAQFGGPVGRGGGAGGAGGAGGDGFLGGGVEMLTPTEGVDFTSYLARVVASVKRNWYAVMPESVYLGDKGRVVVQFRILRNGGVPGAEPALMSSSGKDPLDRAAMGSIRASSPFEPLPTAFSGPYIELRFIFLYNLPLNSQ